MNSCRQFLATTTAAAGARLALYDLSRDLGETKNLIQDHAAEAKRLADLIDKAKFTAVTHPE